MRSDSHIGQGEVQLNTVCRSGKETLEVALFNERGDKKAGEVELEMVLKGTPVCSCAWAEIASAERRSRRE